MHPPVLLLLISVSWMILDRACSSPLPFKKLDETPFIELLYEEIEEPDFQEVVVCTERKPDSKRVCYTFKTKSKVQEISVSDSETRARRQVDEEDFHEQYKLEQLRYAKEQELRELKEEQEALAKNS